MSLPYRLGSSSLFARPNDEDADKPSRVVFLSVEGTVTEVRYFNYIERYRKELGIDAIVHVEVLRKHDTKSGLDHILGLLEEYIRFRDTKMFEEEIASLDLGKYDTQFIRLFLENSSAIPPKQQRQFEAVLRSKHLDLRYLQFLSRFHGEDDVFGIVIDKDQGSHSAKQISEVITECKEKGYRCYITNPCLEFWLLLHVSDVKTEFAEQLDEILDNKTDEKGNTFVSNLLCAKTGERKSIKDKTFRNYYLPNVDLAIERAKGFASREELLDKIGSNLGELFALLRM